VPAPFGQERWGFWNIPNLLTVARVALVPVMVALLWNEPDRFWSAVACAIFVVAMITDIVDGALARRWGLQSNMGAYLDPLADKLMVTAVLVMLVPLGRAPAWLVVVLLCRELAITGLRGIASQDGLVIAASSLGKLKTAYQGTALGFLLWHHPMWGVDIHSAGVALLWMAAIVSVTSGVDYARAYRRAAGA
jgi:CDP-diacylglycerol--glycerol-3-phosphate 3-phosphatidyltransferase